MTEKIHFYAPASHDYISPTLLWSVARMTINHDGAKWLETQWVGGRDFQGLALYTSVLDAAIAAEVLNQSDTHSEWKVYPLSDLNITEMMISMKARQKEEYNVMIVFGYSIDDFRNLELYTDLYRSLQFPDSFPISEGLDPVNNKVILNFGTSNFEYMNDYWHEEFTSYCESIEVLNAQPFDYIKEHAHHAVESAQVTRTPVAGSKSQFCVSTYSIEKQMWVVSSSAIHGTKPANNLH
ncbi:hypothetical protein I5466_03070 [Citrobacter koseri]|uniref:hypothetical protein n=1 Tax=Citrobacter koseri TaxID=545 RepID=UPI0019065C86|nr:hypothetical protein [Citrobacter koseri]MBJ9119782.1 hypothetical protein [Citrobacter koseri]